MPGPSHYVKPLRWLAHLPLAILPLLAAAAIEGPRLEKALAGQVAAALAAAGQGWATIKVDGRDVRISGTAPGTPAAKEAQAVTKAIPGVRRVTLRVGTAGP